MEGRPPMVDTVGLTIVLEVAVVLVPGAIADDDEVVVGLACVPTKPPMAPAAPTPGADATGT